MRPNVMTLKTPASNDNTAIRRTMMRESYAPEELVATRRRLKLKDRSLTEGAVGKILSVRSPGRLYDVSFPSPEAIVMTLSHCDIARCLAGR